jgi:hypothetical protein
MDSRFRGNDELLWSFLGCPSVLAARRRPTVPAPMVQIQIVRMPVHQGVVRVLVHVQLDTIPLATMRVPVMLVVDVPVRVGERIVRVQMVVPLGEVEPDTGRHECGGGPERRARRFAEQAQHYRGTEVPGSPEMKGDAGHSVEEARGTRRFAPVEERRCDSVDPIPARRGARRKVVA